MQTLMASGRCGDLVKCAFSLSDADIELLRQLMVQGPGSVGDLTDGTDRSNGSVYRSLQRMLSCGLVYRDTRHIEQGGYYYLYAALPRAELNARIQSCVGDWKDRIDDIVSRFEVEF